MADESAVKDSAALEEATDRVIRAMTQVEMSGDAVARVMARVRAAGTLAAGAATSPSFERERGSGWFGALVAPRVAWSTTAAVAALAAIVAAGVTLVAVRGVDRDRTASGTSNGWGTSNAAGTSIATAAPTAPVVTPVRHTASTGLAGGIDPKVGAALVMTPDEDPPRPQQAASASSAGQSVASSSPASALPAGALPAGALPAGQPLAGAVPQDVKLDVIITDQSGSTKPTTKTVTLIVADREAGSIQSETRVPFAQRTKAGGTAPAVESWNWESLPLNVNVWPTIMPDGHVRVKLVLNYRTASPSATTPDGPLSTASVTKNLIAVLSDGKPLVVSTSADAATDRKVTVEVKATIQK